jgi:hypothetical protein
VPEVFNVNDVLEGHVVLDLDCLDRIYLNGYVPKLQVGGQVITFLPSTSATPSPHPPCSSRLVIVSAMPCGASPRSMAPSAASQHAGSVALG